MTRWRSMLPLGVPLLLAGCYVTPAYVSFSPPYGTPYYAATPYAVAPGAVAPGAVAPTTAARGAVTQEPLPPAAPQAAIVPAEPAIVPGEPAVMPEEPAAAPAEPAVMPEAPAAVATPGGYLCPVPPPPRAETRPLPPVAEERLTWEPGHWDWSGGTYAWSPGRWVPLDGHGTRWQPAYWALSPAGCTWVPAHWLAR